MFDGFQDEKDAQAKKRWMASAGTSVAIYLAIGTALASAARTTVQRVTAEEPSIDVTFADEAPEPEPEKKAAPPPPPPTAAAAKAKKAGKKALITPKDIPAERPAEAMAASAVAPAEDFEADPDGEDGDGAKPAPKPVKVVEDPEPEVRRDPIDTPEDFTPARRQVGGVAAVYPEDARAKGIEAEVIVKISISDGGEVAVVQVLRGDEPFLGAALAVVKSWRYTPALIDGRPVASVKIVKIPFRIRA